MFPSKLPKGRARTEYCAADTQVCRTVCDGGLKIGTHPCRDPGGLGVICANPTRHCGQLGEGIGWVHAQRRHGHESSKREVLSSGNTVRKLDNTVESYAAAPPSG
jgi:hypothetical protein